MSHHHSAHSNSGYGNSGHCNSGHGELGHIVPVPTYIKIFVVLVLLTGITVAAAQVDFGAMNLVVAMLIASVKATLVALFFMHLKYEHKLTWGFAILPLILLGILLFGVFIDNPYRGKVEPLVVHGAAK